MSKKYNTLPAMGGNALPTIDQAAIDSGFVFLQSELEKIDPTLREPLTSTTYARDIFINSGGGWVEATSNLNVDYAATGDNSAVGGVQNNVRRIQANVSKDLWPVLPYEMAMSVKFMDVQRGAITGRSIEQMYNNGIRLDFDKYMDNNVYLGIEKYGTHGLLNQPKVSAVAVQTGAEGSTEWAKKTPDEILEDINQVIMDVWTASGFDQRAVPNHILISPKQYSLLVSTPFSINGVNGGISLLTYLEQNNMAAKKGVNLVIAECRFCDGIGVGKKDRMVAYVNDPYFIDMDMPVPLTRAMTQPNIDTASYDSLYVANVGCVKVHYPTSIAYRDGI